MKKIFLLSLLFIQITVFSQQPLKVEKAERPSSMGIQPAFEVAVPNASVKDAEELFKNSMHERKFFGLIKKKADSKKSGDEWMTEEFDFKTVSDKPMVVLFQAADYDDLTYVRFFFIQDNQFLGSSDYNPAKVIRNAESFVQQYAVTLSQQTIQTEIDSEKKALSKLEKKLRKLKKKGKRLRKKMANRKDEYFGELVILDDPVEIDGSTKGQKRKLKGYERRMRRNYKQQQDIESQIANQEKVIERLNSKLEDVE
ncbi:hypothetical protein [Sunxiuqinia indica]|uniref:hypothetical protein n=1 Tax=Sunxiuqinia indica TaxID=2692584 RepID=UPI00135827BF|nr:hypothetical protein [Sunxiuqinia indica]